MSDGGKGSTQRPRSISGDEWAARWDAIFQRDLPKDVPEVGFGKIVGTYGKVEKWPTLPASMIEGIMSTETCGHPFCDCKDVCKEAK